jgi:hypothetical protein
VRVPRVPKPTPTKKCAFCDKTMARKKGRSDKQWERQEGCSPTCGGLLRKERETGR